MLPRLVAFGVVALSRLPRLAGRFCCVVVGGGIQCGFAAVCCGVFVVLADFFGEAPVGVAPVSFTVWSMGVGAGGGC